MPGNHVGFGPRADRVAQIVGQPGRYLQQRCLACGFIIMHPGFNQGAGIINIVLIRIISAIQTPALRWLHHLGVSVQKTIRLFRLSGGDAFNITVQPLL